MAVRLTVSTARSTTAIMSGGFPIAGTRPFGFSVPAATSTPTKQGMKYMKKKNEMKDLFNAYLLRSFERFLEPRLSLADFSSLRVPFFSSDSFFSSSLNPGGNWTSYTETDSSGNEYRGYRN